MGPIGGKPERHRFYLDWVKSLPSVISGLPADDPHHLIGHGYGGSKVSDYWTFPLTRIEHGELHHMGQDAWEVRYGSQWRYVAETMLRAKREGIL